MATLYPVILAGGSGDRLWPISRQSHPKTFQGLAGSSSLLRQMAARVADPTRFGPLTVLAAAEHRFLVADELRGAGAVRATLILEPVARDTAPALAAAAAWLGAKDPAGVILALPADLTVESDAAFLRAVDTAHAIGVTGRLVRIPQAAALVPDDAAPRDGEALILPIDVLLAALQRQAASMMDLVRAALDAGRQEGATVSLDQGHYERLPAVSIEHAILQSAEDCDRSPAPLRGRHLDSFGDLWSAGAADPQGNVVVGSAVWDDSRGCYLHSEGPLIAAHGLENLVVVATPDVVLVSHRGADAQPTALLALAKASAAPSATQARRVHRPWGSYETLHNGPGFQVKQLRVAPGGRLSLQKHAFRSEHWVVVEGTATVHLDGEVRQLGRDQSLYIPQGAIHRLENPTEEDLVVVEVQTGDYLGEDDIVRLEDVYARGQVASTDRRAPTAGPWPGGGIRHRGLRPPQNSR